MAKANAGAAPVGSAGLIDQLAVQHPVSGFVGKCETQPALIQIIRQTAIDTNQFFSDVGGPKDVISGSNRVR